MATRTRGLGVAHQQRKTEIADAVLDVVAEQGLSAVSLSAVAARANVSVGRVQHYFPTKNTLLEAAFDRANQLSGVRITERLGRPSDRARPREVLTVVLTELIPHDDASHLHMRVRQSFTALALAHETIARRLREEYANLHATLGELVRREQAEGHIATDIEPHSTAQRLVALAEGLAYYVLIGVSRADIATRQVLDAIDALYRR